MVNDESTPIFCPNPEILERGETICIVEGLPDAVEHFVQAIAKQSGAKTDWHYVDGCAHILHLGDGLSRQLALNAIHGTRQELKVRILDVIGLSI